MFSEYLYLSVELQFSTCVYFKFLLLIFDVFALNLCFLVGDFQFIYFKVYFSLFLVVFLLFLASLSCLSASDVTPSVFSVAA